MIIVSHKIHGTPAVGHGIVIRVRYAYGRDRHAPALAGNIDEQQRYLIAAPLRCLLYATARITHVPARIRESITYIHRKAVGW